jgi:hypothetical protein
VAIRVAKLQYCDVLWGTPLDLGAGPWMSSLLKVPIATLNAWSELAGPSNATGPYASGWILTDGPKANPPGSTRVAKQALGALR